jgi:hypothetical protein
MYIPNKTLQCVTLVTPAEAVFFTGDSLCVCVYVLDLIEVDNPLARWFI